MHHTALMNAKMFFECYSNKIRAETPKIVEIGSQDVNGSLRDVAPTGVHYTGVDFCPGKGVDLVLDDPYVLPFENDSVDIVVSSSCFEHSEMFWIIFLEIMRVIRPGGLFYLNAPSNGLFHRYPVDCWRFYPDCGGALVAWARRNGMDVALLESYTSIQDGGHWNDFVAVFLKGSAFAENFSTRISYEMASATNIVRYGEEGISNYRESPEDQRRINAIRHALNSTSN